MLKAVSAISVIGNLKELSLDVTKIMGLHKACLNKAQDNEAAKKSHEEELKALAKVKKLTPKTQCNFSKILLFKNPV